jgi:diaminopimelate epimerase
MRVSKYQGLGNDFVIADLRAAAPAEQAIQDPRTVAAVCDRHFGLGADGVLAVLPATSAAAHARMRVLNADGGEAEMCGNGLRCVVKHLAERDPQLALPSLTIDTGAGPLRCAIERHGDAVDTVTVDMGRPRLGRAEIPMTGPADQRAIAIPLEVPGLTVAVTCVSMGNPHVIAFVDQHGAELRALAERFGPTIETHAWFPNKTNVEMTHVHGPDHLELVVWERGCGITLACGTGACATAVAACLTGVSRPGDEIKVSLLGGDLAITVADDYSTVLMRGPARHVYDAELDLDALLANG